MSADDLVRAMLEQTETPLIDVSHLRVARDVAERLRTADADQPVPPTPTLGAALGLEVLVDDRLEPGEWRVVRWGSR